MMFNLRSEHLVFVLILAAALLRLVPHPDNIAPIGALALFSGAYLQRQVFWLVPLGALLLGDAAIGFYHAGVMLFVYFGFLLSTAIGRGLLLGSDSWQNIALATGLGAIAFWTVSHMGVWLAFYPATAAGLLDCYSQGLPYLLRSLLGDCVYVILLFGGYRLLRQSRWVSAAPAS
ncbi:MAG: DUF6580 family putative transport protein [Pseudomonadota bacterium]